MQILAKSGVDLRQLNDKKNKGAECIEMHLFRDDVSTFHSVQETFENIKKSELKIGAVHTPISSKYSIEGLLNVEGFRIIENTCNLASMIAELQKKQIHVVLHQDLALEQLLDWGMYKTILEKIEGLLSQYEDIVINLENLSMHYFHETKIESRNNFFFENVELCKRLRKDLSTNRIGTVLDTCHALSTIRHIKDFSNLGLCKEIYLEEYFEENKDFLNIIHLANARDYGYGEGHGVGFDTNEDVFLLKSICKMIKDINFNGLLTLEVGENDYLDCQVFPRLKNQVEYMMGLIL